MTIDLDFLIRSAISMLVITSPFDPVKILFFNQAISDPPRGRIASATKVAVYVVVVLGGSALVGRKFLDLIGVNLDVFGAVGGLVIALMGFEMLYGGATSKAQGDRVREKGPDEGDALLIPLTLPLIAGPGAIATTISIAASGGLPEARIVALHVIESLRNRMRVSPSFFAPAAHGPRPWRVSVKSRLKRRSNGPVPVPNASPSA